MKEGFPGGMGLAFNSAMPGLVIARLSRNIYSERRVNFK